MTRHSSRSGFTLTEVLIVVAIGVVLTASGFLSLNSFRNRKDVEFSMLEVTAAVRGTRERSITQEDGFGWGIRFTSTSTGDTYEVFQGSSYANGTTTATHSFRRPVEFGEPSGNRTVDIIFSPISGKVSTRKIITVAPKSSRSYVGDIIVNTQGLVTQRMEDGIVGYWHFNEGTGTSTYDASSNDNTGTLTNGPTWQSGSSCKVGGCLDFNGSGDYVSIINPNNFNYDVFTVSAWINTTVTGTFETFIGRKMSTQGWNLLIGSGNKLRLRMDTSTIGNSYPIVTGPLINDGNWHHIAAVVNLPSSQINLYVDGEDAGSSAIIGGTFTETDGTLNIMGPALGTGYSTGKIDEVRIYNRALTASEIQAHYDDLK